MNKLLSLVLFCAMAAATTASSLRAAAIEAEDQQPTVHRNLWGNMNWGRPKQEPDSIAEIAADTRSLSTLVELLEAADLVDTLDGDGPFTVFAPDNRGKYCDSRFGESLRVNLPVPLHFSYDESLTSDFLHTAIYRTENAAFEALDAETRAFLTSEEGRADLEAILTYHVVVGETVRFYGRTPPGPLASLNGAPIETSSYRTPRKWVKKVNDAMIKTANLKAKNGIIHIIDSVMIPPTNATEPPAATTPPVAP